jgi:hypothetical protein
MWFSYFLFLPECFRTLPFCMPICFPGIVYLMQTCSYPTSIFNRVFDFRGGLRGVHDPTVMKAGTQYPVTASGSVLKVSSGLRTSFNSAYSSLCFQGNSALFGPCIASSGKTFHITGLPGKSNPAYAGLPFLLSVVKMDHYNQTILSDSSSFAQLQIAAKDPSGEQANQVAAILSGEAVFKLDAGQAQVMVSVKPALLKTGPASGQQLDSEVFLYAMGEDLESSQRLAIYSSQVSVTFATGELVCPKGYILSTDSSAAGGETKALGVCTFCKVGTYSINPLAGGQNNTVPACLNCPPSSTCSGGDQVILGPGEWMAGANGMYLLVGCPPGHELINSIGGTFRHDIQVIVESKC